MSIFWYVSSGDTLRRLHLLDTRGAGNLEGGAGGFSVADRRRYIANSLMEKAIASSQLEGAAKQMLRQNRRHRDYSEKIIVNDYRTIRRIAEI